MEVVEAVEATEAAEAMEGSGAMKDRACMRNQMFLSQASPPIAALPRPFHDQKGKRRIRRAVRTGFLVGADKNDPNRRLCRSHPRH